MATTVKGYLDLKSKGTFGDTWRQCLCEFNPSTRNFTIYDEGKIRWSKTIDCGITIEARPGKRPNRLDVMALDGSLAQLSAPSADERSEWIEAFDGMPEEQEDPGENKEDSVPVSAQAPPPVPLGSPPSTAETSVAPDPALASAAWEKVLEYLRGGAPNAKEVKRVFDELGGGKRGEKGVLIGEIGNGLLRLGVPLTQPELQAWFRDTDTNGDGRVSLTEFTRAVAKERAAYHRRRSMSGEFLTTPASLRSPTGPIGASTVWSALKAFLAARGEDGLAGLRRVFEAWGVKSEGGDGSSEGKQGLTPAEFLSGLNILGVNVLAGWGAQGTDTAEAVEKELLDWCLKQSPSTPLVTVGAVLKECGKAALPTTPRPSGALVPAADHNAALAVIASLERKMAELEAKLKETSVDDRRTSSSSTTTTTTTTSTSSGAKMTSSKRMSTADTPKGGSKKGFGIGGKSKSASGTPKSKSTAGTPRHKDGKSFEEVAAGTQLEAAMSKLLRFIQADKRNAVSLSTVFVRQERLDKSRGVKNPGGLPIHLLMTAFENLKVGFTEEEATAFHAHFDTNHDGKLSLVEFTEVIAGSAWRRPSRGDSFAKDGTAQN